MTFTDIAAANLGEVRWWLEDDPRQFDYRELLSWLEAEVGADPLVVTESLRSSPWDLVRFASWTEPSPDYAYGIAVDPHGPPTSRATPT